MTEEKNPKDSGMTETRRALMLGAWGGENETLTFLHFIDPFHRCDKMLKFLIDNRIVGSNLLDWLRTSHGGSMMNAAAEILRYLDKEMELRPIEFGRDLKQ